MADFSGDSTPTQSEAGTQGMQPAGEQGSAGSFRRRVLVPLAIFLSYWGTVLIPLGIVLGIRHWVVEARYIPSGSMLPGLQIQDRLLVEKLSYRRREPRRGEIVVFRAPHAFDPILSGGHKPGALECLPSNIPGLNKLPGLANPACDAFIKRVIGLPGDRISVDPTGHVAINGKPLAEPYVRNWCPFDGVNLSGCKSLDVVVPAGKVVVLGDNRSNSWDARFWPGGPFLPDSEILGRAFWRLYPFNRSGSL